MNMQSNSSKKSVAVLFGGRSAEHEISILTALQAISAIDSLLYQVVPVYLAFNGKWYTGPKLFEKEFYRKLPDAFKQVQEVTLLPDPSSKGLVPITPTGELNVNKVIPIDIYFLAFHGQYGEDGCVQGLLELKDAAYTGCTPFASALAMNKYVCKIYLQGHQIPVLPGYLVKKKQVMQDLDGVCKHILATPHFENFPLFVKPCHLGSSIGISKAEDLNSLKAGIAKALYYDDEAIVEPCLTNFLEINIAVMDGNPPRASVVEIPMATGHSLTYEDKYLRGNTKGSGGSSGMASLSRIIDPKHLDAKIKQEVSDYALKAYQAIGCSGSGRFDFMMDLSSGQIYFNELNPIPGSLAFYLWDQSSPQLLYTDLLNRMLTQAIERKSLQLSLQRNVGFKAL